METKYLNQFVSLFQCLDIAADAISEGYDKQNTLYYDRKNRLNDQILFRIDKALSRIETPISVTEPGLLCNLIKEVDDNLYSPSDYKIIYIKDVIRHFAAIAPFLDRDATIVWHKKGKNGITIGTKSYSKDYAATILLLLDEYKDETPDDDRSNAERYIISCSILLRLFSFHLDITCLKFGIELMEIQKELNIWILRKRIVNNYVYRGYEEKFQCLSQKQIMPHSGTLNLLLKNTEEQIDYSNPDLKPISENNDLDGPKKYNNWDSFLDNLTYKYDREGIAELERLYMNNNKYIYPFITQLEKDRTKVPIVAKGITAYLADFIFNSFHGSLPPNFGQNVGIYFEYYFDRCIKFLIDMEDKKKIIENRKTRSELVLDHFYKEVQAFSEPQLFYTELRSDSERPVIELIKNAASGYPQWVKKICIEGLIKQNKYNTIDDLTPAFVSAEIAKQKIENNIVHNSLKDKSEINENTNQDNFIPKSNHFCRSMLLKVPIDHFKTFTETTSQNGKPFLTIDQLNTFIDRAFCGNTELPMQKFNQATKGEKLKIQKVFYDFYSIGVEYFRSSKCRDNFIRLLTDNFIGWDFENVKNNFSKQTR